MIQWGIRLAFAWTLLLACVVVLPIIFVALASVIDPFWLGLAYDRSGGAAGFASLAYIWDVYGGWWWHSIRTALVVAALNVALAVPAAWTLVRRPFRGSRLLEDFVLVPLAVPGIAMAIALISAFGAWRGTWLVGAGHMLYTLPFLLNVLVIALRSGNLLRQDAVAASLGAGLCQRWRWIILPQLRGPLSAGLLLVVALSWGEFNVSYLLNSGATQTFPAALYDVFANDSLQRASAATVLFLGVLIPLVLSVQAINGRSDTIMQQGA